MTAPAQPETWRLKLLVIDEFPDRLASTYLAWRGLGANVDIETSFAHALHRMQTARYGLVLVPVVGSGQMGDDQTFVGEKLERWAAAAAPNYQGRFVFYGLPGVAEQVLPNPRQRRGVSLLTLPAAPSPRDIERSIEQLSVFLRAAGARRRAAAEGSAAAVSADPTA